MLCLVESYVKYTKCFLKFYSLLQKIKMTKYWWVNQNKTYESEVTGGYMWSPKVNKNGGFNKFYDFMIRTMPGDIVFSYADTKIKTVGEISNIARDALKPKEFGKSGDDWNSDGWLVEVDYQRLKNPIKPKKHMDIIAPLLPRKYSPIRPNGDGNQIYLSEISKEMAITLLNLIGNQVNLTLDDIHECDIQNRTDIGATEKYQLVRSRVGQGQYRKNLDNYGVSCHVTGITDGRFLTASHIKPWVKSDAFEKLDGNNGLLLSPNIDRLFDRGFITFQNTGHLVLSLNLPSPISKSFQVFNGM